MKQISKIIMAIGVMIAVIGGCGLDSEGQVYLMMIFTIFLGIFIALVGWLMLTLAEQMQKKRDSQFYIIHQRDRLDVDVEFIDLDKKIAP